RHSPVYDHATAPHLHSHASVVPTNAYPQDQDLEVMKAWHGQDRRVNRLLSGIYRASDIDRRHSVVGDFIEGSQGGFFYLPSTESFLNPSTAERNALYAREAGELDRKSDASGNSVVVRESCITCETTD